MEKLLSKIYSLKQTKSPILIALDGRSGTGKSSIAKRFAQETNATIIESDDFYSGIGEQNDWQDKTPQEKVDLVIDWKRLREEVLEPLLNGESATYRRFNFKKGFGLSDESIELELAQVIILDGAYSSRPELQDLIDISVLVKAPDSDRRNRLQKREGKDFMQKWHAIWDEAENLYFDKICPEGKFDFVIPND